MEKQLLLYLKFVSKIEYIWFHWAWLISNRYTSDIFLFISLFFFSLSLWSFVAYYSHNTSNYQRRWCTYLNKIKIILISYSKAWVSLSTLLYSIQQNIFRIGGPILIVIGNISCILNLIVFTKDTLRKSPCTICFVANNIIDFLYFYLDLLLTTLAVGYNTDPSTSSIIFLSISLLYCLSSCMLGIILFNFGIDWSYINYPIQCRNTKT